MKGFWPINGLKCLINDWFKKKVKLMVGAGNEGFVVDGRRKGKGDEQLQPAKISRQKITPQPHYNTCKTED